MAWDVGWSGKVEIVAHTIETINEKDAVKIVVRHPETDEAGSILIFLTAKSMGMARAQLKVCGFDPDKTSLAEIVANDVLLAGNFIPIYVDEYNGKAQLRIDTRRTPPPSALSRYDKLMRDAKKSGAHPTEEIAEPEPAQVADDDLPF